MRPDWPKGFFRKGNALYGLGHYEDAVIAFLQCLALDKEAASVKEYLSKVGAREHAAIVSLQCLALDKEVASAPSKNACQK